MGIEWRFVSPLESYGGRAGYGDKDDKGSWVGTFDWVRLEIKWIEACQRWEVVDHNMGGPHVAGQILRTNYYSPECAKAAAIEWAHSRLVSAVLAAEGQGKAFAAMREAGI